MDGLSMPTCAANFVLVFFCAANLLVCRTASNWLAAGHFLLWFTRQDVQHNNNFIISDKPKNFAVC